VPKKSVSTKIAPTRGPNGLHRQFPQPALRLSRVLRPQPVRLQPQHHRPRQHQHQQPHEQRPARNQTAHAP
jgi:hypothetical protein